MSEANPAYRPRCKFLCSKSMIVYGENFENDPEFQSGMAEFWCIHTSKNQGPDGEHVSLKLCSDPERTCFEEF